MTKIRNRKSYKGSILLVCLALVLGLAFTVFKLLEPVFVWNIGWKSIPTTDRTAGEQTSIPVEFAAVIASMNTRLDAAINTHNFPALSIAVGHDGKMVWARAMGFRDLDSQTPVTLDTKFRIGSVSKALTATTAAKLSEENILNLDAPIRDIVPYFPQKKYDITPRQLFTHTAGIRHYGFC